MGSAVQCKTELRAGSLEGATVHHILYIFKLGAILLTFISLGFLSMSIWRGRRIPRCMQCGAPKVRPSTPAGFLDLAASVLQIHPYRCMGCRARFHAVSFLSRSAL
jgi:hypothetical protein